MSEAVEIVKAMISPVEKLIDAVSRAIGKVYEPIYVKKNADARAYEIEKIGNAMREASDIPVDYDKNGVSMDTKDFNSFSKRAEYRHKYQELVKQKNIECVTEKAYLLLQGKPEIPNVSVDSDWMLRFFNSVQDISNEDMQQLWAKILSEEILSPGAVSLRTLTILAQMTSEEAKLFERVSKYILHCESGFAGIEDYFIPSDEEITGVAGISFVDILRLEEMGLFSSRSLIATGFNLNPGEKKYISCFEKPVICVSNLSSEPAKFYENSYLVHSGAIELLNVIAPKTTDITKIQPYLKKCEERFSTREDLFREKDNRIRVELNC